jgi:hypothetical protein
MPHMPPAGSEEQVVRADAQPQAVALAMFMVMVLVPVLRLLVTANIIGSDRLNELFPFPASWRGDA